MNNLWRETFLLSLALPILGLFTLVATMTWVKINWLIPAYPPLLLLMLAYYENKTFHWKWTTGFARWMWITVLLFFILLHLLPFVYQIPLSGSADTITGWQELAGHLEVIQKSPAMTPAPFIFTWGHKTASELQYYLKGNPSTYAQTVLGEKALGYDYWFDPKPLHGRDALFVWSDYDRFPVEKTGLLEKYFSRVKPLEPFTVFRGKYPLRTFHIYWCIGYQGYP